MAAIAGSSVAGIGVNTLAHSLEIEEKFTLKAPGSSGERLASAKAVKLVGRRLIVQVSGYLEPGTAIRIDCDDAFLLGETLGCWVERGETFAALELQQALTRLTELAKLQEEYWDPPLPSRLRLLQSA